MDVGHPGWEGRALGKQQARDHPGKSSRITDVVPQAGLEVGQDGLVESGSVPGGIFGSHKQKVSPTGDASSYFLSGPQSDHLCFNARVSARRRGIHPTQHLALRRP